MVWRVMLGWAADAMHPPTEGQGVLPVDTGWAVEGQGWDLLVDPSAVQTLVVKMQSAMLGLTGLARPGLSAPVRKS